MTVPPYVNVTSNSATTFKVTLNDTLSSGYYTTAIVGGGQRQCWPFYVSEA
ncbi:MAG: hypothetical protein ACLP5V_07425 [Candidatus Bathyarchaeia archaeon]